VKQLEPWLSFGCNHDLQIIVIEPFFEEANRCRRLVAEIMRRLDLLSIGSCIADLPGTGESPVDIADVRLADWRRAAKELAPPLVASFRGGALIDDVASLGNWRFAPETGSRIVRDLKRTTLTNEDRTLYAGHPLSEDFLSELELAMPLPCANLRTVRLDTDAGDADVKFPGSPLWRRAEPGEDSALASALAADLANWARLCVKF
jgi:hypothetical protein